MRQNTENSCFFFKLRIFWPEPRGGTVGLGGSAKNSSKVRQKCIKNNKNASKVHKIHQKCIKIMKTHVSFKTFRSLFFLIVFCTLLFLSVFSLFLFLFFLFTFQAATPLQQCGHKQLMQYPEYNYYLFINKNKNNKYWNRIREKKARIKYCVS